MEVFYFCCEKTRKFDPFHGWYSGLNLIIAPYQVIHECKKAMMMLCHFHYRYRYLHPKNNSKLLVANLVGSGF